MYVLDTDVFSITSPTSGFSAPEAEAWRLWVKRNQDGMYFSVVTIIEVRFGIEKSGAKGATKKAERLRKWLAAAETVHRNRIIPVTIGDCAQSRRASVRSCCGRDHAKRRGRDNRGNGRR
jgi:predicted nucleic acid-binding protein